MPCPSCLDAELEARDGLFGDGIDLPTIAVHVQDMGLYREHCLEGHSLVVLLENQPYELLFESGLEAFVEGYFRESISSFAAALERLYEFSIRVQLISDGVDAVAVDDMWRGVSSQSERQLGMYIGIRTSKDAAPPNVLGQSMTKLRNSVIHKGYFPNIEEAHAFGEAVYDLIGAEIFRLNERFGSSFQIVKAIRRAKIYAELKEGESPQVLFLGLAVSRANELSFSGIVDIARSSMLKRRNVEVPAGRQSGGR